MKKTKAILLIFLFLIIYVYVCSIEFVPSKLILFQGEQLNINTLIGIKINSSENFNNYNAMLASTKTTEEDNKVKNANISLDLFGKIPLKEIDVNVIPKTTVIPLGNSIGLRLYTKGVLVVGMSEIRGQDNSKYKPYENSGIKEGDTIISVNNKEITNTKELIEKVNNSEGKTLMIQYIKENNSKTITTNITPVKTGENEYKLGLWVRDAAEGVGTITFYEPSSGKFGALGHPIIDVDTGDSINISKGELITSEILSITKGTRGKPGEIRGIISNGEKIGEISQNTNFGIFGNIVQRLNVNLDSNSNTNFNKEMEVALRSEIKEEKAYIMCELENGKVEKFEIEIKKIYSGNNYDNKSMLIKVTDKRLLEKTGGIIQRNVW